MTSPSEDPAPAHERVAALLDGLGLEGDDWVLVELLAGRGQQTQTTLVTPPAA